MPKPQSTPDGKWVLYDVETGKRLERWPVDARSMLATDEFTRDPPRGAAPPPPVSPEERGIVENPEASVPVDQRGEHVTALSSQHQRPVAEAEAEGDVPELPEGWPAGYEHERSGGYYGVTAPDGSSVRSHLPSGMFQGEDAARAGAWRHAAANPASTNEATDSDDPEASEGSDELEADEADEAEGGVGTEEAEG